MTMPKKNVPAEEVAPEPVAEASAPPEWPRPVRLGGGGHAGLPGGLILGDGEYDALEYADGHLEVLGVTLPGDIPPAPPDDPAPPPDAPPAPASEPASESASESASSLESDPATAPAAPAAPDA